MTRFMSTSALSTLAMCALIACGDDDATGGGGGTTSTTTSTVTTQAASTGSGDGGGGGGDAQGGGATTGAGAGDCVEVALSGMTFGERDNLFHIRYDGTIEPPIVAPSDYAFIGFYDPPNGVNGGTPGTYDLSDPTYGDDDLRTCSRCFLVETGIDDGAPRKDFFQESGTVVVEAVDILAGTTSFSYSDVILREVERTPDGSTIPVPGGECLALVDAELELGPPRICDSSYSTGDEEMDACIEGVDGSCEAFESCTGSGSPEDAEACAACIAEGGGPLCDDALAVIHQSNCLTPPDDVWSCADDAYWDGEICDCECGTFDPDCSPELAPRPVEGCDDGVCSSGGACVPFEFTCDVDAYAAGDRCDCGCSIQDPDCEDDGAPLVGCDAVQTCTIDSLCEGELSGCADPRVIDPELGTFSGDTTEGTGAPRASCAATGLGVTFSFTAPTSGDYTFTVQETGELDLTLGVRSICDQEWSELANSADDACVDDDDAGTEETTTVALAADQTVFVVVSGFFASDVGGFEGSVTGP